MGILEWLLIVFFVVITFGAIGIAMYYDWQEGAAQSYIWEDGTIHEWDRFGNQTIIRPDGRVETARPEPDKGIGRYD